MVMVSVCQEQRGTEKRVEEERRGKKKRGEEERREHVKGAILQAGITSCSLCGSF